MAQTYITPPLFQFIEVEDESDDCSDGCCILNSHLERQTKNTRIEKTIVKKKAEYERESLWAQNPYTL